MTTEKTKAKTENKPSETKEVSKKIEIPKKFAKIVEDIGAMSVLDLSELVKVLEDTFGVSAAAPVAMMAAGVQTADGGAASAAPAKSTYTIELTAVGGQKIAVIKAVREVAGLGLKDAKDLVDKAPTTIKENVPKAEAEEMKKKIEEAGGTVELK